MAVTIRRAEERDLDTLRAAEPRPGLELARQRFDEMAAGTGILAVAEQDGVLMGSGYLDFVDEELNPELKNLWVLPEHRRHGAGGALFGWLEEQAREAGHQQVFLSVSPDNHKAIPLFLEMGYSPTGHHVVIEHPVAHELPSGATSHTYAVYRKSLRAY